MRVIIRYITGYILAVTVFLFLIPFGFYKLSKLDYLLDNRVLINAATVRWIISLLFFLIGACFMLWSNIFLFKVGQGGPADGFGIPVHPRTKKLVTTGPYRYSRNPMVFGAFSLYASITIFLNSIIGLSILLIFLLIAVIYLKLTEEKRLLQDFGNEHIEYKKKVSMIFPLKQLKK